MALRYTSYGLSVVADTKIPGLAPSDDLGGYDVFIHFEQMPSPLGALDRSRWYESPNANRHGRPNLKISRLSGGAFHFEYDDQIEFLIEPDGSEVWCNWSGAATLADAAVYLRGPILGFVLRLRGVVCLHASAVAIAQEAIAILAPAGGGKSTTAASFVKLGFSMLSDDVVALEPRGDELLVLPGYPRVNLWPDAAEALYGSRGNFPRMTPALGINAWWDKRFVDLEPGTQFCQTALPLAAVYVLGDRTGETGPPSIEALSPQDAFVWLTDGTSVNYALDESMRATEFRLLGQLIRTIPVRHVTPHDSHDRLPEMCNAILDDFRQLKTPAHV
jgi:hypothetical protein